MGTNMEERNSYNSWVVFGAMVLKKIPFLHISLEPQLKEDWAMHDSE